MTRILITIHIKQIEGPMVSGKIASVDSQALANNTDLLAKTKYNN